jgi:phage pi2 protein 07
MGAYLMFQAKDRSKDNVKKINDFLEECEINKKLGEIEEGGMVFLFDEVEIEWAKKQGFPYSKEYINKHYGRGDYKISGISEEEVKEKILDLLTELFDTLNNKFEMEYYAGSCAFTKEEYYFSIPQMKKITRNGELLSGKSNPKYKILKDLLA